MAGTLIVAVRSTLVDQIGALWQFAKVRCDMTWSPKEQDREQLFTTNATFEQRPASLKAGRTFRNEDGAFSLMVQVIGVGKSATESAERAVELGTVAEEFIADHRTSLGVEGLNWLAVDGQGELTELFGDRSTMAQLTYRVTYNARLT